MNDLEQMIRDSLGARADDVEATPLLWEQVQRRTSRRRVLTGLYWAVGAAAAAVLGVTVVPAVLDGPAQPDVTIGGRTPSEESTQAPPAASQPGPTHVVVAGQRDVRLVARSGDTVATLVDYGVESEAAIGQVAVRPGSHPGDLTVAFSSFSEGEWSIRWFRWTGTGPVVPEIVAVPWPGGVEATMPPAPVWSPDGSRLAWIGSTAGQVELWATAWDVAGPIGDGSAVLGSADGLDQLQLEEWVGDASDGTIHASSTDLDLVSIRLEDGTVADVEPAGVETSGAPIDMATGRTSDLVYVLSARGDGSQDAEGAVYTLAWTADGERGEIALPDELSTMLPPDAWMAAVGDLVTVGNGGSAWVLLRGGGVVAELDGVVAADPVPLGLEQTPPDEPVHSPSPAQTPAPGEAAAPAAGPLVVLEDDRIVAQPGTEHERTLLSWPDSEDVEWRPAGVSVRPGSTLDDLTVLVMYASEGTSELGWVHAGADGVTPYRPFPEPYQPAADRDGRSVEAPVWSSDGAYLAWVDEVDGSFSFRAVGWDEGPGTGRTADDNMSVTLTGDADDMVLDEWTWIDATVGLLRFRVDGPDGHQVADLGIERQPDGALAFGSTEPLPAELAEGVQVVDVATVQGGAYRLLVAQGEVRLAWLGDLDTEALVVPGGIDAGLLLDSPPAAGPYLSPAGEGALLRTPQGEVWFVSRDGASHIGRGRDAAAIR